MKYIFTFFFSVIIGLIGFTVQANPEISNTANSAYCHWPQDANNANNETFQGSCTGAVTQEADGTGTGTVRMVQTYAYRTAPYQESTQFNEGNAPALECELEDTNGTQYISQDWSFSAIVVVKHDKHKEKGIRKAFHEYDDDYDYDNDGDVDGSDLTQWRIMHMRDEVTYVLTCRNAAQQQ